MQCPTCQHEMTLLLVSWVCDRCDGLLDAQKPTVAERSAQERAKARLGRRKVGVNLAR